MSPEAQNEADLERIKAACGSLIEHFDTVQILCTRCEPGQGGTVNWNYGQGNIFARAAQAHIWSMKEMESIGGASEA